jgi:hypothetical protein
MVTMRLAAAALAVSVNVIPTSLRHLSPGIESVKFAPAAGVVPDLRLL